MHPKRIVIAFCTIVLFPLQLFSEPFLVVYKSDGSTERIPIASINKITFDFNAPNNGHSEQLRNLKKITSVIKTTRLFSDISYMLKRPSRVTITAYDLNGKVIRTLRNQTDPAGSYKQKWDYKDAYGHDVPAGSYIIKVAIDKKPYSKCLFVVR